LEKGRKAPRWRPILPPVRFGERNGEDRREQSLYGVSVPTPRGFDSVSNRKAIFNAGLIPNIKENPRNRKRPKRGRKRLFNQVIHDLRDRVERTFAWEDKFKRLLLRFEHLQRRHYGMKLMAYTLINVRRFCAT
jgi:transposase